MVPQTVIDLTSPCPISIKKMFYWARRIYPPVNQLDLACLTNHQIVFAEQICLDIHRNAPQAPVFMEVFVCVSHASVADLMRSKFDAAYFGLIVGDV